MFCLTSVKGEGAGGRNGYAVLNNKTNINWAPKRTPKWVQKFRGTLTQTTPGMPGSFFLVAGTVFWQHKAYFCWQALYFVDMQKMRSQAGFKHAQDGPRWLKMAQHGPKMAIR